MSGLSESSRDCVGMSHWFQLLAIKKCHWNSGSPLDLFRNAEQQPFLFLVILFTLLSFRIHSSKVNYISKCIEYYNGQKKSRICPNVEIINLQDWYRSGSGIVLNLFIYWFSFFVDGHNLLEINKALRCMTSSHRMLPLHSGCVCLADLCI